MCRALLPEMLMCSWSLSISCPVPSRSISSFSSFLSCWPEPPAWLDRTGGDARTGFTRPTWGSTGMGGRTGVTPGGGGGEADVQSVASDVQKYRQLINRACLKYNNYIFLYTLYSAVMPEFGAHTSWGQRSGWGKVWKLSCYSLWSVFNPLPNKLCMQAWWKV